MRAEAEVQYEVDAMEAAQTSSATTLGARFKQVVTITHLGGSSALSSGGLMNQ